MKYCRILFYCRMVILGIILGSWAELGAWLIIGDEHRWSWEVVLCFFRITSLGVTVEDGFIYVLMILIAMTFMISIILRLIFCNVKLMNIILFSAGISWGLIGLFAHPDCIMR